MMNLKTCHKKNVILLKKMKLQKLKDQAYYLLCLKKKQIPYQFSESVSKKKRFLTNKYLNEPTGWVSKGYTFIETNEKPLVVVYFEPNKIISKKYNDLEKLSVTDFSTFPIRIYFNKTNWLNAPKPFIVKSNLKKKRKEMYRKYLVQHEFGHVLGFGHPSLSLQSGKCDVMLQQTKWTEPYCEANFSV